MGLFDSENSVEQQMFELAVQKVNIDPMFSDVYLHAKIQMVDSSDSYKTGVKGAYRHEQRLIEIRTICTVVQTVYIITVRTTLQTECNMKSGEKRP